MPKVLVIDDTAVDRHLVAGLLERSTALEVQSVASAREALAALEAMLPDLVITDLMMPGIDTPAQVSRSRTKATSADREVFESGGLQLVEAVTTKYPSLPVIVVTSAGTEQAAVDSLAAGATTYIPKAHLAQQLVPTVLDVLARVADGVAHKKLLACLREGALLFELSSDPELIPPLISYAQSLLTSVGLCDDSSVIRVSIALEEAIRNAMFHGNLELTSEQREGDPVEYQELLALRSCMEPFRSRRLHLSFRVSIEQATFVIRDEGPGFDPRKLPDPTDPANIEKVSGRGLLLMRTFMDEVHFNATGNEVTMIKRASVSREGA